MMSLRVCEFLRGAGGSPVLNKKHGQAARATLCYRASRRTNCFNCAKLKSFPGQAVFPVIPPWV